MDAENSSWLGKGCRNLLVPRRPVSREDVISAVGEYGRRECVPAHCGYSIRENICEAGRYVDEEPSYVEQELPVYVADIDDPCLLGLDYLLESRACLDFGEIRMEVQGKEVPLLKANATIEVVATKTTCVPPRMETWVSCRLSRDMENEVCLVESLPLSQLQSELLVGKTLVWPDDEQVRVLVANLADEERQIPAGAAVRSCEAVELAHKVPGSGPKEMAVTHGFSAHLEDVWNRSIVCLDKEQAVQLEKLLQKYTDVSSPGDLDLGRTNLVKHRINTGNHPPIKQPPRRVAPARCQEMEKAVGEHIN
ncbi:uncharacterized protein LOC135109462 [Scylla paramamosain]|uniref:uncharacterized protein LOC135109462 n=1 Tax=Scylla paramamosain TaxID=85552 RepID=UPI0030828130